MSAHDALSRGFDAGNYAHAYVSEELEEAWEDESNDDEETNDLADEFRAAFVIGFFSSLELDEILDDDHREELETALNTYGETMKKIGIAVDREGVDDL